MPDTPLEKRPRVSWGVLCLLLSARVPVVGTFDGSRDLSNPNISVFQFDVVFPKWSGGSETGIKSSSFSFETSFPIEVHSL